MRKFLITSVTLLAVVGGTYLARAWIETPEVSEAAEADPVELARLIDVFEARVETSSPDPLNLSVLGRLYLTRATMGYGLDDYERAREVLVQASDSLADNPTLDALAGVHLALHDFEEARRAALLSVEREPTEAALATLADAEMALGHYEETTTILGRLAVSMSDEPAYLVRVAQLAYLTGDMEVALDSSRRAAENAEAAGLPLRLQSFYMTSAGRMQLEAGRYDTARDYLQQAIALKEDNPSALFEMGRVEAALGRLIDAVGLLERSVALVPDPAVLAFLGDTYLAAGEPELADRQYETVAAISSLDQSAYRRSVASAFAARGINPGQAIELSELELAVRQDPTTWHVYALALYQSGRVDEAYDAIKKALGPADARLWYHAGLIAAESGHRDEAVTHLAKALDTSPMFHPLEADGARLLLEDLES